MEFLAKGISLEQGEKIVGSVKHHFSIILPSLAVCTLILVLDFFMLYYLFLQGWKGVLVFFAVFTFSILYSFKMFFLLSRNKVIVTSKRLIDCEQRGFFDRSFFEIPKDLVIRSGYSQKGIVATMLNYGNLQIMLKRRNRPFEIYKVARPRAAQALLASFIGVTGGDGQKEADEVMKKASTLSAELKLELAEKLKQSAKQ
jgi:hypothetical protein